jgi:hypothetical protein
MPPTGFRLAPTTVDGLFAVPFDVEQVQAVVTLDGGGPNRSGQCDQDVHGGPDGQQPALRLRQTIGQAWVDGTPIDPRLPPRTTSARVPSQRSVCLRPCRRPALSTRSGRLTDDPDLRPRYSAEIGWWSGPWTTAYADATEALRGRLRTDSLGSSATASACWRPSKQHG